jgi:flagellar motor switch protein FliN
MADKDSEGLLSQDDINAALAAAGLESEMVNPASQSPAAPAEAAASAPADPAGAGAETRVDAAGRPFDEVAAAMAEAIANEKAAAPAAAAPPTASPAAGSAAPSSAPPAKTSPFEIPELAGRSATGTPVHAIDLLRDVELNVKIELGRSRMLVDDVLRLGEGSVVELDKLAGDPVDVLVNDRLIARGEVLVLNDNFCVRINDIISRDVGQEAVG